MDSPTVAVIIPSYGHPGLMAEAIESALAQQAPFDYRIVIVNDGCLSPATDQVARHYARIHPERIVYVHKPNGGLSSARNRGIATARAAWPGLKAIYLLDADNRIEPAFLDKAYSTLTADPPVGWAFPDIAIFGSDRSYHTTAPDFFRIDLLSDNYCEAGSMFSTALLEHGVRFDETMKQGFEDWDFWLQGVAAGFKGRHIPASGFRYRRRPESMLADTERDRQQVLGYMRRKHGKLITARNVAAWERAERPRFALLADDEITVTSDVSDLSLRITTAGFLCSVRRWRAFPQLQPCPATTVIASPQAFALLGEIGILANVLWLLEADLRDPDRRFALLTLDQEMGVEIGAHLTAATAARAADWAAASVLAVPTALLADCLDGKGFTDLSRRQPPASGAARHLRVVRLDRPRIVPSNAAGRLVGFLDRHGEAHRATPPARINSQMKPSRTAPEAAGLFKKAFNIPPFPPLPVRSDGADIALTVPIAAFGGVERIASNLGRELDRAGYRPHLFVIGNGELTLLPEFRSCYRSIHIVPDSELTSPASVVSLLGTMAAVINNHAQPVYKALGDLRRLGVKLVNQLQIVDLSSDGLQCGNPYWSLEYEHSYHLMTVPSRKLGEFLTGKGVPAEKVMLMPNAPSFEASAARLDSALAERAERPAGSPLRALFMARFDRQKGLDRVVELVCQTEITSAPIEWRVVGKAVIKEAGDTDPTPLKPYLRPPAIDAATLSRHLAWADVLILTSRFEGAPLTILEAQQFGCVPLSTAVGAVDELIVDGETGFLFPSLDDRRALAEAMLATMTRLQADRRELVRVGRQAAEYRRGETWGKTAAGLIEWLRAVCPVHGGAA